MFYMSYLFSKLKRDARAKHKASPDKGEGKSFIMCLVFLQKLHTTDSQFKLSLHKP